MVYHPITRIRNLLLSIAVILASSSPGSHSLRADEARARFYDQLRQRQLFSLVEADCLTRLAGRLLSERERGELSLELSRTYAAHAWQTIGAEQEDLWQRGKQVLSASLEQSPKSARHELFETQWALIDLSRAEWLLAQSELRPDDRSLPQQGLSAVRLAIERLTILEKSLGKDTRSTTPANANGRKGVDKTADAPLTPFERRALSQQIRFRLGTAQLVQSKLSEPDSADQAAAIVLADELLSPLAVGTSGERLTSESQLVLAEVARLRGDLDRAARILATFEKTIRNETANELRERFVIERVRWWLAKGLPAEAAAFLIEQRKGGGLIAPSLGTGSQSSAARWSPELAYWQVTVELALWHIASEQHDAKLAKDLWERTQAEVTKLEQEDGGYWASRAQHDWQAAREAQQYGRELAALIRRARAAFSAGQADEALNLYDEAIASAKRAKQRQLLLELADTRASLLFQSRRFDEAAAAFRGLAEAPRHERSAATHLLWAFCLAKIYDKQPTDEHRAAFVMSLDSLIERYPAEAEAAEATWLLGQLAERQQQFADALGLYAAIPMKHARRDDAWAALARCHERLIAQLRADKKPTTEAEDAAIAQLLPAAKAILAATGNFKSQISDFKSDISNLKSQISNPDREIGDDESPAAPTAALTRAQAELLVRLARLLLERQPADVKQQAANDRAVDGLSADQLLERVLTASRDAEWRKTAGQLRVISLAAQRTIDEAERVLDSLEQAGPDELLSLLDGLTAVSARCDSSTQRLVAELQLRALQDLAVSTQQELSATQRSRLWRARMEAYAATGQISKAITASEQLLEKSPRDAKLLRTTAELCELLESDAGNKHAKALWRRLESVLKSGSADWLDVRWHVIRCCRKLGEQAEADKLLKVTKLLYPDLGGPTIKAKFDGL